MAEEGSYLYRGTTPGWPGTRGVQEAGVTPTTTDPLVATLFAIECRNHGQAIILVAPGKVFAALIGKRNHFAIVECAVNIMVPPDVFARNAVRVVDADQSIAILNELGFRLPIRIARGSLLTVLNDTHAEGYRMSFEQIQHYDRRVFEEGTGHAEH
jgi:hypothetical protein